MEMNNEAIEELFMVLEDKLDKTVRVLKEEYTNIRAGRANPHILDKITVDYYGAVTPINQIGNISVSDAKCLVISPWDTSMLKEIEKAILQSNIGLTPTNDGKIIRLVFPDLTEERRKDLAKNIKKMCEEAKVATRNIRREILDSVKKMKNAKEVTEDEVASYEKEVDKFMVKATENIEKATADKEKEILSV
jgi:ribosome recycling factor